MASSTEAVDWRKLREFADVDLEQSFVLSWNYEAGTLFIDIDLLLLPDHPFYEKPRPVGPVSTVSTGRVQARAISRPSWRASVWAQSRD